MTRKRQRRFFPLLAVVLAAAVLAGCGSAASGQSGASVAQSAPAAALLQHPQRRCRRQQGKERGFAHLPWAVPYGGERVGQRAGELFLQRSEQDRRGQGGVECQHIRQELFHTITSREYMRRAIRKSVAFRPRIL